MGFIFRSVTVGQIIFHVLSIGFHSHFNGLWIARFLPNLTHLLDLSLFYPNFPVLVLFYTPPFVAFMLGAALVTSSFFPLLSFDLVVAS